MSLAAIIIAKNAEKTIARVIQSVQFADETIVIVDKSSADQTKNLATAAGAKVISRHWSGFGSQKNFGARQAQGDWLLFVDDDEEVTDKLRDQIQAVTSNPNPEHDIYWLRIVTVFLGRPLRHLYGHNPRLFKKSAATWTDDKVHEQLQTSSGTRIRLGDKLSGLLASPLMHHSHPTIKSYLKKMHQYTSLDAAQMKQTNLHRSGRPVKPSWFLPHKLFTRQFIKLYFYKQGFLDGYAGFMWSVLSAYYEFEMAVKYNR